VTRYALLIDLARALDPPSMADIIGMKPDLWQRDVLASYHQRILMNCHRQAGKSTVAGVAANHQATYWDGSMTLLVSPSQRQSGELFRKVMANYKAIGGANEGADDNGYAYDPLSEAVTETALTLELENGSRIISLPGKADTIRGYSAVDLVIIDEASVVDDVLMAAIRPMLAVSGGRIMALSTPKGKRGWWYEAWENGGAVWKRVKVVATECPRITPEFLAEERVALGPRMFAQEYMGEFVETQDQVFSSEAIRKAFDTAVDPLF
jgi:Helicase